MKEVETSHAVSINENANNPRNALSPLAIQP